MLGQKEYEAAIDQFRKSNEIDSKLKTAYLNLGVALAKQGNLDEAIAAYRKYIEIDTKYPAVYNNLGIIFAKQGKNDEALAMYRKCIELNPKHRYGLSNICVQYIKRGEIDKAVATGRKCIESNPKWGPGYNALAAALRSKAKPSAEDLDESIRMAQRACELFDRFSKPNANALNTLGISYYRAKQWLEALDALQQSIDDHPELDNPNNWLFIAMCHWQQKDEGKEAETEARKWYEKSLEWLKENEPNEELKGFYAEAAERRSPRDSAKTRRVTISRPRFRP